MNTVLSRCAMTVASLLVVAGLVPGLAWAQEAQDAQERVAHVQTPEADSVGFAAQDALGDDATGVRMTVEEPSAVAGNAADAVAGPSIESVSATAAPVREDRAAELAEPAASGLNPDEGQGSAAPAEDAGDSAATADVPKMPAADSETKPEPAEMAVGPAEMATEPAVAPTSGASSATGEKAADAAASAKVPANGAQTPAAVGKREVPAAPAAQKEASGAAKTTAGGSAAAQKPAAAAPKAATKAKPAAAKEAKPTATSLMVAPQATPAQQFKNGEYYLESSANVKLVLDMSNSSKVDGGNALAWNYSGNANQRWKLTYDAASGCYYIANTASGKVLSIAGGTAKAGANVLQWAKKTSNKTQLWRITSNSTNGCTISAWTNAGLLLGLKGGKTSSGTNVNVAKSQGAKWQNWWLVPLKPQLKAAHTIEAGVYAVTRADAGKQVMDVERASQDAGATVAFWNWHGGGNQKWALQYASGNLYRIVNVSSGKSLDISNSTMTANAKVMQWNQQGTANQQWAVRKNSDGTFSFVSSLNGMTLSSSASKKEGAQLRTWFDTGAPSHRFILKKVQAVQSGLYSIGMRLKADNVFSVNNASEANGAAVSTAMYSGALDQKYQVRHQGDDVYTLQAAHSGKYVTDSDGVGVLTAKSSSASAAQRWKAEWRGTGLVLVNQATGRALSVKNGSTKSGIKLTTSAVTGANSQRFAFTPRTAVEDGMYIIHSKLGARVVDVAGSSKADGGNVELWSSHGGNNQKFQITAVGAAYKIVNVKSGKALDVAGGSKNNGANVQQWGYHAGDNQLWTVKVADAGGLVFVNVRSGKVLDVTNAANANGANIQVYTLNGSAAQRWSLEKTQRNEDEDILERAVAVANRKSSETSYLVTVDLTEHRTVVFQRSGNTWTVAKNWICTTGAPSTPTVEGDFTVGSRGYSFGSGYTCYYWTQIYGDYLFHSVLYHEGTRSILDGRLGRSLSHGCVRLDIDNAYWIYENIPSGTKVVTFY